MTTDGKKGNAIIILIIILIIALALIAGGLILTKPSFLPGQNRETVEPSPSATPTSGPISTPISSSTPSSTPKGTTITEITGTFYIIYGDPQPDSGDQRPRYRYSVTDDSGKTTIIKIDSNTKLIGGKSIADFDRKRVEMKGSQEDSKTLIATFIELL